MRGADEVGAEGLRHILAYAADFIGSNASFSMRVSISMNESKYTLGFPIAGLSSSEVAHTRCNLQT